MREAIFEKLNGIFRDVFDDDEIYLSDQTTAADIEGWDSLMHITLMEAIEDDFGIKFTMRDIVKLENVGQLVDVIVNECGEKG